MDEEKEVNTPSDETPEEDAASEESGVDAESPPEEASAEAASDEPADEPKPEDVSADLSDEAGDVAEQLGDLDGASDEEKAMAAALLGQESIDGVEAVPPEDDSIEDAINNLTAGMESGEDSSTDESVVRQADFQQLSSGVESDSPRNINLLMDVELPVSIELGRTRMNIADILALGPGSVVELEKLVGEPVDLLVNQKCVARGEVVVVDESFGLRITQLISPEERLKELA
jgi:flagellar motor switch protein FliN